MKKKVIGIVIPGTITYSETFFTNKIDGLITNGFEVLIFATSSKSTKETKKYNYRFQWRLSGSNKVRLVQVMVGILYLALRSPNKTLKYINLERQSGSSLINSLKAGYINAHILLEKRVDHLHFGYATMGVGKELLGKTLNCNTSCSFRGYDIDLYPLTQKENPYLKLWKHISKVHSISEYLLRKAQNEYQLPKNVPSAIISPAISSQMFNQGERSGFFKSGKVRILMVGRLTWKKGHEYAFLAIKELRDLNIDVELTIVGKGDDWERLNFAKHQLNLESAINFEGALGHHEIIELMNSHDIFLHPSVQEGFGNAVLEAQASGLLCVVGNAGGLAENVMNEETGWVVPSRDPNLLAEKIIEITKTPMDILMETSRRAQVRVRDSFDLGIQEEKFKNFFEC